MSDLWKQFEREVRQFTHHIGAEEFDYAINVSLKYNYIYVENAKVACSTIKLILQRMELGDVSYCPKDLVDMHSRIYSPLIRPAQVGGLSRYIDSRKPVIFCFVRNPYTRLLSAYLDKICNNMPAKAEVLQTLGKNPDNLDTSISFEQFVDAVGRQSIVEMNPHWRVQYYQTCQDRLRYDLVGRFENLEADLRRILEKINPSYGQYWGRENRHATDSEKLIKDYYSPPIERQVYKIYQQDFQAFGYQPLSVGGKIKL